MALITTQKLFIDVDRGVAYQTWNNFSLAPTPIFHDGDTAQLELFLVRQTDSTEFPMEEIVFPSSSITAAIGTPGGTPAASGTTWTALSAPTATYSAPLLTIPRNAIGGYFTVSLTNTTPSLSATTRNLTLGITALELEEAIETAINSQIGWSNATAIVTGTGAGKFAVTVTASHTTSTTSTLYTITVAIGTSALLAPAGYVGELALTGAGVDTLLGSAESVESTLEVQILDGTKYQTYLQIACTLRKQVTTP